MKKSLLLIGGAVLASAILSGCAGVTVSDGAPMVTAIGMNIYSDTSANAMIQPITSTDFTVVKRDVKATATLKSFFTAFNFGDASYETLKAAALAHAPGATDLTDVVIDYKSSVICGINEVTVTLTATAIKYNK